MQSSPMRGLLKYFYVHNKQGIQCELFVKDKFQELNFYVAKAVFHGLFCLLRHLLARRIRNQQQLASLHTTPPQRTAQYSIYCITIGIGIS